MIIVDSNILLFQEKLLFLVKWLNLLFLVPFFVSLEENEEIIL